MLGLANNSVSILRGTTPNAYGDETDDAIAAYTQVPAAIVESSHVTTDPATQTPRTVRAITCVMPGWADVLNSDRLQDATGTIYMIESVTTQPSLGYPGDTILTLRRVTGTGT
jgi:hypothetical protein